MGIETIKEQDAATLYRDDIVKYLILINRRRAFPEIIDGLKPVQRRIIFDMFSQVATSFNKRVKESKY
jgi:DNA gyrase/topoisomerase IV subunit A